MPPEDRLQAILHEGRLRSFVTFSGGMPCVCLSESDARTITALIRNGMAPWGLVLSREWVFGQGGAPVWYIRDADHQRIVAEAPELRHWAVRLAPGESDWLWEREWRIPSIDPVPLHPDAVVAVVIGDARWTPGPIAWDLVYDFSPLSGGDGFFPQAREPSAWIGKPRWLWRPDLQQIEVLPPAPPPSPEYHSPL
jgi:hypothetical protein